MINDNLRIMLVEDHPFQLRATQCLLESYGFTQLTTSDCATGALQHMVKAEQPFDILLCDQCLPEVSGIDLIKIASHRGMIKQAILLSSLTSIELIELENLAILKGLPLLGYLIKPLNQCELRQLLTLIPQTCNDL
ncbi:MULTISPECIES: response regulator [Pseudomonas]|jgi:response regulator of citrate/malate metabolism|uniref:response regulator n=1 Tax=Pseudomonas TaxID=286 RepID=UPI00062B1700|nr:MULTISPECIES: response regulator [Pseudomonas]KKX67254.1 response regulator [Pseudomonas putida]MCK8654534.1 response regulator [Pseudomonas umsongensis]OMQ32885.1 response regulator [Pseudomonas putida]